MAKSVQFKRSRLVSDDGVPKSPTAEQLEYGEPAVNYAAGYETMFFKNSENEIVSIPINGNLQTVSESLNAHLTDTNNPHRVTKEQVGLENVDNTSDFEKPLSSAQSAALNLKLNKTSVVDNLTTNDATRPLSAAQGIVLLQKANEASGGATADLTALNSRILAVEQELEDTEDDAQAIIDRIDILVETECNAD